MWSWLKDNADPITAAVAVIGLLVATYLAWRSIKVSSNTLAADTVTRVDGIIASIGTAVHDFQYPAILPYWKPDPVDPESAEAMNLTRAFSAAKMQVELYADLDLEPIASFLEDLQSAMTALYLCATNRSPVEVAVQERMIAGRGSTAEQSHLEWFRARFNIHDPKIAPRAQPTADAWAQVSQYLIDAKMPQESLDEIKPAVLDEVQPFTTRLEIADQVLVHVHKRYRDAYKEHRPVVPGLITHSR